MIRKSLAKSILSAKDKNAKKKGMHKSELRRLVVSLPSRHSRALRLPRLIFRRRASTFRCFLFVIVMFPFMQPSFIVGRKIATHATHWASFESLDHLFR
jgi:hypothetical protein